MTWTMFTGCILLLDISFSQKILKRFVYCSSLKGYELGIPLYFVSYITRDS
jgi:hypothetical protein